jgi:hypothetical protein
MLPHPETPARGKNLCDTGSSWVERLDARACPGSVKEAAWVSPLGLPFRCLCRFMFLTICMFLHRVSGALLAPMGDHLT